MVRFITAALAFALTTLALPSPLTPDPAGDKNIGNGAGQQFIGGACLSGADCASTCCATLSGAGICSGLGAQFQAGKTGCGFGGDAVAAAPAATTATTAAAAQATGGGVVNPSAAGSQNVGKADGSQFITGQCLSDADCASACCSVANGQCASPAVATCGFVAAAAA
ncbi:hypothetical protein F4775DRAFT_132222 [Biscogniauxia sp. FL1348]|nr:hypothetical protein F4775DRAFT_132222 [Biscogniauxia sp. FL1348]